MSVGIQLELLKPLRKSADLFRHQRVACGLIQTNKNVALLMRPGSGKTAATLFGFLDSGFSTLIVAPLAVTRSVWQEEAKDWEDLAHLTFTLIRGTPAQRFKQLQQQTDYHIINYDLLPWLAKAVKLSERYNAIIFDELSMMKSPSSKRFKSIRFQLDKIPSKVGLTGTPMGNSMLGFWSQLHCVAGSDNPLGRTYTNFKPRYFQQGGYMGREWLPYPWTQQQLLADAKPYASSFDLAQEYGGLNYKSIPFKMPLHVEQKYKELVSTFVLKLAQEEKLIAPSIAVMSNKLKQLESGAVYGEDRKIHQFHTAKLDAVEALVNELQGDPLLIFYEFKHELDRLKHRFPNIAVGPSPVNMQLWNRGQLPLWALHPKSAGHGLNLQQGGANMLFFTAPWSYELWEQSKGRLYRTGQTRTVYIYTFKGAPVGDRVIKQLQSHQRVDAKTFSDLNVL